MKKVVKALSLVGTCAVFITGCGEGTVSFESDVRPILARNCLECHQMGGEGFEASGLAVGTYDQLMKGTKHASVVKPNDSFTSALMMLVEGRVDQSIGMPHGKEPLNKDDIDVIRKWIDQGARNN